jgi:Leucine-rich repeat (LRR) protein
MGKFYCALDGTSHHALKPRHQCTDCARFYCDSALDEARRAGLSNCVFCDGKLIPVKLKTDSLSISDVQREESPSPLITTELEPDNLTESGQEETLEKENTYVIEIIHHDLQIIRLTKEVIGQDIPFLEGESINPTDFGFLVRNKRVVGLSLYNHNIGKLPTVIGGLSELEKLYLRYNALTTIPEEIGLLTHLQELDLSYNQLVRLPAVIGEIPHLHTLLLNDNHLEKVPVSLTNLTELMKLDLQNNPCWNQPRSRKLQRWINNLRQTGCDVAEAPATINYHSLELSFNEVELLEDLERFLGIKIPLIELSSDVTNYDVLLTIPFGFITFQNHVIALGLGNQRLAELPRSIKHLKHLKFLNLSYNRFSNLPSAIWTLPQLQILNLENNNLKKLEDSFDQLKELKVLNLKQNQFKRLPKSLGKLKNLEVLLAKHNQLISLPSSLRDLQKLKLVDFRANPIWEERENRRELQKWFKSLKNRQCQILGL